MNMITPAIKKTKEMYSSFKNKVFALAFLFLIIGSCTNSDPIIEEQKVYSDIFPELIEKTFQDFRKSPVPPPPPYSPDMTNKKLAREYKNKEEMDEAFRQSMENHKIYLDTTDFAPLFVIVGDTVKGVTKKGLKKAFEEKGVTFIDTTEIKQDRIIDLSNIKLSKDYVLRYKSEDSLSFDELVRIERTKYSTIDEKHLWQYSGILYLSRVYFNPTKDYGFLNVGFHCGKLCGCGYRVFIKKFDGKWTIDEIKNLGCS